MTGEERPPYGGGNGRPRTIDEFWFAWESERRATVEWRLQQRQAVEGIHGRLSAIEADIRSQYVSREVYEADKKTWEANQNAILEQIGPLRRAYNFIGTTIIGAFLMALAGLIGWRAL